MRRDTFYRILCLVLWMAIALTGCSHVPSKRTISPNAAATASAGSQVPLVGVVVQNDIEQRLLTLQELGGDIQTTLHYDTTSVVTDRYGMSGYGEDVEPGEIMEVQYRAEDGLIQTIQVPEEAWEYQEVTKYTIDSEEKSIQLADRKYQYANTAYVGSSGRNIELMELNRQDVLTVRGVG